MIFPSTAAGVPAGVAPCLRALTSCVGHDNVAGENKGRSGFISSGDADTKGEGLETLSDLTSIGAALPGDPRISGFRLGVRMGPRLRVGAGSSSSGERSSLLPNRSGSKAAVTPWTQRVPS